ncbi:hypothetical protein LSTR_LSTR001545 [Laodelphax striatellus]|uniref:Lipase domain-containing protein n=1 Tax=Laodelphax striatellus TaxID=195883 RepID=A0A482XBS8_LAOST|nr:hypothetical protein LSTR_LSTR001545 [Laodelphax striatellus]
MVIPAILCTSFTLFTAATPFTLTLAPHGDCTLCCPVVWRKNVKFNLYTRRNPEKSLQIQMDDYTGVQLSPIRRENPTVIYIHGFTELDGGHSTTGIRKAYLRRGDYNVLIVDWSTLSAFPWYEHAVANTPGVGKYVAQFLHFLTLAGGLTLATLHVVGFRLDPAFPLYMFSNMRGHLSPSDAEFVDVIHTDGGVFGFPVPLGHADFFPNGGTPIQPGCWLSQLFLHRELRYFIACSHNRAWMYYAESVNRELAFEATACNNYHLYLKGKCPGEPILGVAYDRPQPDRQYMGFAAHPNLRGKFYLKTNQIAPYGISSS